MAELSTTERYALSQILVCGAITIEEFKSMSNLLGQVQDSVITELQNKNVLQLTLVQ